MPVIASAVSVVLGHTSFWRVVRIDSHGESVWEGRSSFVQDKGLWSLEPDLRGLKPTLLLTGCVVFIWIHSSMSLNLNLLFKMRVNL